MYISIKFLMAIGLCIANGVFGWNLGSAIVSKNWNKATFCLLSMICIYNMIGVL